MKQPNVEAAERLRKRWLDVVKASAGDVNPIACG